MARFLAEMYTLTSRNKGEYKGVKVGNAYWFEANSVDDAIITLHSIMKPTTYILKMQHEQGYRPIYKAIKAKDGAITVLNDCRKYSGA